MHKLGFRLLAGQESRFEKDLGDVVVQISMIYKSRSSTIEVSPVVLALKHVEDILMRVKTPINEI